MRPVTVTLPAFLAVNASVWSSTFFYLPSSIVLDCGLSPAQLPGPCGLEVTAWNAQAETDVPGSRKK